MKKLLLIGCLTFITACLSPLGGRAATSTPALLSTPAAPPQTPTTSATVIATFTSIPTLSPTPYPLYFTEEFDSIPGTWVFFQTSGDANPEASAQNGSLVLNFSSPHTWYYAVDNVYDYLKVHVEAKFESTGAETNSMGLVCMYSDTNGWYEYNLSSDGTYNILFGQWLAQDIAQYKPIMNGTSEYLTRGRTDYEVGITCEKDLLWLYINGKLFRKIDVSRYGLEKGKIGVAAAVFESIPVTAYFDWFKVSEPIE